MKAMEKIKLSKERVNLIADLKSGNLKGLAKIKASKRVVEIVVLLGGDGVSGDWQARFIAEADAFGKSIAGYMGASTSQQDVSSLAQQAEGSWMAVKSLEDGFISVFYTLPDGKYGGGEGRDELQAAYDVAMAFRDQHLVHPDRQDSGLLGESINPLYQSVLDGAAVTIDLVKQVRAEGQKDPDHPQLRPAVRVIHGAVKAMAA